jgi:hypothetical protein
MLFIDTQQYLDLYRMNGGKKLLEPLRQVGEHVFVTSQIADEVTRNKLEVAHEHLTSKVSKSLNEEFKALSSGIPNHLFSPTATAELEGRLGAIRTKIQEMKEALDQAVGDLLGQISRSEDEVSRVLARIFERAVEDNSEELARARDRKERGAAPGKKGDPLGDQINWEQLLARVKSWSAVWILSKDGDYCVKHGKRAFLNSALYRDLLRAKSDIKIYSFTELERGLRDFIAENGLPAVTLPTPEESEQINREQEALPPFDSTTLDVANWQAVLARNYYGGQTRRVPSNVTWYGSGAAEIEQLNRQYQAEEEELIRARQALEE